MKIQTNSDFGLLGMGYGPEKDFPKGEYVAIDATNQPNWEEEGKIFIENEYGASLLLNKVDYIETE